MKEVVRSFLSSPQRMLLGASFLNGLIGAVSALISFRMGVSGASSLIFGAVAAALGAFLLSLLTRQQRAMPLAASETRMSDEASGEALISAFMEAVPVGLFLISRTGRVLFATREARNMMPRLSIGTHYSHVIRAPEFVRAVAGSLEDNDARSLIFASSPGREKVYSAQLAPFPKIAALDQPRLIVRIEDRTEIRNTERLRTDFVANASHELRTPLASILGYLETLQHHARDDPAAREKFLAVMVREARRMQRLIQDLMSLSRIELNEHMRPQEPCSLGELAAEAATALRPLAEAEGVELDVDLPTEQIVPGDRDLLCQVFSNLIENAIRYAGPGASVRVREASASSAHPNRAGIMVEDTGPGIPREYLVRLTERFYRVNTTQSRNKGGTGLGLAIVKHILNRHEGRLEISSSVGEGSRFTVWLPRQQAPEARADAAGATESS